LLAYFNKVITLIIDYSLIIFYNNKTTQMAHKCVPNTLVSNVTYKF
jgi:hypothetical protein